MTPGCWSVTFCGIPCEDFLNTRSESHFLLSIWCDTCVWSCKTLGWSQPPAATLGPALLPNFTSMTFQLDYKPLGFAFCLQSAQCAFTDTYINCICLKGACYLLKGKELLHIKSPSLTYLDIWMWLKHSRCALHMRVNFTQDCLPRHL